MGTRGPTAHRPEWDIGGLQHVLSGSRVDMRDLHADMAGARWAGIKVVGFLSLSVSVELFLAILL